MRNKFVWLSVLLFSGIAGAAVTLPYSFSPGGSVSSSQMNADFGALRDEINTHESQANGHNSTLSSILSVGNSCGSTPINFNGQQGLDFLIENVTSDPVCVGATSGRMIFNTVSGLLKVCNGSSFVSVAGTGVNTLSSVLNAGNSAGTYNLDVNENQLLHARVENLSSDPSVGNIGRLYYNTTSNALKLDTGSSITAIGGSQGLSSVLGVSNSAGSTNVNFNGNQALDLGLERLASDPGTTFVGRLYYNTTIGQPKFYTGSAWVTVGNTNTLAQTLALGNSVGSYDVDFNSHQAQNMRLQNLAAPPGTGTAGMIWYDTISNILGYETTTANHTIASLDDAQTLTNKTISGSSNTITNVPDNALSANVGLLTGSQTVSGTKTFSAAPVISKIKTPAGTTNGHTIPNGIADDTFILSNATQTLYGKTLSSSTISGSLDFAENTANHMRVENVPSLPSPGNSGRLVWNLGGQSLSVDNGTNWVSLGSPFGSGSVFGPDVFGVDTGSVNTFVITTPKSPSGYSPGVMANFIAGNTVSGSSTINLDGLGVVNIKKLIGATPTALALNDIVTGSLIEAIYDGSEFIITSGLTSSGSSGGINTLVGDATGGGTGAVTVTVTGVQGAAVPASKTVVGTNSSSQIVDASSSVALNADNLSHLASASTARTNLGLGTSATHPSTDFQTALGYTPANTASNLSDLASASTARTNLGLGTSAIHAATDFQTALGYTPANVASNLSDLANASTARTNLGLGTAATQNSSYFQTALGYTAENTANKGTANGYTPLDSGGKISTSYLPSTVLGANIFQGVWDASTAVYPASPSKGNYWIASVAGTISGTAYKINDWLVYDGTAWDKIDNSQTVSAVNGAQGSVTVNAINQITGDVTTSAASGSQSISSSVVKVNGGSLPASATVVGTNSSNQIVDASSATLSNNTSGSAAKWTTARTLAGNSVDGSANVAFPNKFLVQGTTDAGLTGAQFMGALGTGIVKNTTTTGVQSIAVAADFPTLNQNTSGTAALATAPAAGSAHGAVVLGSGGAFASVAPSTTGNVLTSNGTDWVSQAASGGGGLAAWASGQSYTVGQIVTYGQQAYTCKVAHNPSSAAIETDISAGKWMLLNTPLPMPNKMLVGSTFEDNDNGGWATVTVAGTPTPVPTASPTPAPTNTMTPNMTVAVTSSSPLSGIYSLQLSNINTKNFTAGEGVLSPVMNIDPTDQAKILTTKFAYQNTAGGAYNLFGGSASGNTWGVYIWDVTNSAWINPQGSYNLIQGTGTGMHSSTWQSPANMTQFQVAVICLNTTTASSPAAGALKFTLDDFYVGPQVGSQGPPMSDWTSFTPTASWNNGNVTPTGYWRRVGDSVQVQVKLALTGAPNSATNLTVNLPSGMTIDTNKIVGTANPQVFGTGETLSNANGYALVVDYNNTTSVRVLQGGTAGTYLNVGSFVTPTVPETYKSGDNVTINFQAPISGWSSSTSTSNDTDYRIVEASYYMSSNLTPGATTQLNFDTKIYDSHGAVTTGSTWKFLAPVTGYYDVHVFTNLNNATTGNLSIYKNGTQFHGLYFQSTAGAGNGTDTVYLNAGDYIDIRGDSASQYVGNQINTRIDISRHSGATVPQASEVVMARYNDNSNVSFGSTAAAFTYNTKVFDTHNAYNSGVFTVPVAGKYRITATLATAAFTLGATQNFAVYVSNAANSAAGDIIGMTVGSGGSSAYSVSGSIIQQYNAGDPIAIWIQCSTTASTSTAAYRNHLIIERIGP